MSILDALKSIENKKEKAKQATKDNVFKFATISDAVFICTLYRAGQDIEKIEKLLTEPPQNRDKILLELNL